MTTGDELVIADRSFRSRLFLGTGKFPSGQALSAAIRASGTEVVTVALRRIDPTSGDDILDAIPEPVLVLTNTSGAVDADEAVRLARLARAAGLPTWIKLEITPDPRYLLPDPVETLRAAEVLVADGFTVLPYCPADPILCRRLEEAGCATVMPLGSWIGSNQGLRTRAALEIIVEQAGVPVVVDAGLGAPEPCRGGHGAGRRGRAGEHSHRDRRRSRADGPGVPARRRGRPRRAAGGLARGRPGRGRVVAVDRLPVVTATPVLLESRPDRVPEGTAAAAVAATDIAGLRRIAASASDAAVDRALGRAYPTLIDLAALLSDAAAARLEDLAQTAHRVSLARFGRAVRLFAPLYLSNECVSTCTYCGFSAGNTIARRTLSIPEVAAEAGELHHRGFRHVLLVSGEHARIVSRDYLVACVDAVAPLFPQVSIEVQVWDTDTYRRLLAAGCDGVTVYQEAYDPRTYTAVHLKGKKRNYAWRLAAPDRAAEAGMRRLAIGTLLGLNPDWRAEALALAAHAQAFIRRWWRCELSVALPRLRPAAGGYAASRRSARRRVRAVAVRAANRAARRRDQHVDTRAGRLARRPGAAGCHDNVGRLTHRTGWLRLTKRRRAAVLDLRHAESRRGSRLVAGCRL